MLGNCQNSLTAKTLDKEKQHSCQRDNTNIKQSTLSANLTEPNLLRGALCSLYLYTTVSLALTLVLADRLADLDLAMMFHEQLMLRPRVKNILYYVYPLCIL